MHSEVCLGCFPGKPFAGDASNGLSNHLLFVVDFGVIVLLFVLLFIVARRTGATWAGDGCGAPQISHSILWCFNVLFRRKWLVYGCVYWYFTVLRQSRRNREKCALGLIK